MRCSDASLAAGEPLAGTATTVERWLLVEVPGTWPRDVGDAEALPDRAGAAVRAWLAREPRARLLFVRRPGKRVAAPVAYVVRSSAVTRDVRRLDLDEYEALADVDLDTDGVPADDVPLVLVCGHGSRDACCALLGTPVYGALAGLEACEPWLSSHQGGHRFAANVLVLPAAVQLGRVEPESAARVVREALAGRLDLDLYRGRTFLDAFAQAGEIAIRRAHGLRGLEDLRLLELDGARVVFRAADGTKHEACVEEVAGPVVPASCGAEPEPQPALRARLSARAGARGR